MAKPLKEWLETDVARLRELEKEKGSQYLYETNFVKDPRIATFIDSNVFYAPASGVIFNQKIVDPKETLLDIKGMPYTLQDLMQDKEFDKKCLVIQTFLTYLDTHVCRLPQGGLMHYEFLPPIVTRNKTMIFTEDSFLNDRYNSNTMDYAFVNERVKVRVNIPHLNYNYYMVLLADRDVNIISFMQPTRTIVGQNERICVIKFGSEANLILPIDEDTPFDVSLVHPDLTHVEVGQDKILDLKFKDPNHRNY